VPNTNGVVLCSTGNNQSSPAAGCDTLLTSGLATYQTIENVLNNGYQADDKINQKQSRNEPGT
jgi:chitinase